MGNEDKFAEIKNEYEENWRRGEEEWGELWNFMDRDLRAYAGNTWTRAELNQLIVEKREAIELPLIRSKINWFTGYQRDNIRSMEIEPVESSDQETADQLSKVLKQVWYRGQGQYHWNQAFEDSVKTGLSLFGMYLDFSNDPINGDIKFYRRGYNSFVIDPDTEQPDLSDCSWVILRDFVTRDQAGQLLPFIEDEVIQNVAPSVRDNKFIYLRPYSRNFNNPNIITFDQYYRRSSERKKLLVDIQSGSARDISNISKEELQKLEMGIDVLKQTGEATLEIRDEDREIVEYNILLSGEVVFSGKDAIGLENRYPFVPVHCFFEPSVENMVYRYQGIVRSLYDAQRIYNKRNMKVLDIMDKVIYGSTKYMLGSVDDPRQLLQSGTRRLIGIQPGYSMDDVQDQQANTSGIAEIIQYSQVIDQLFNDLAGVNDTLLGSDEGGNTQVSGRLAQVRTANGVRANRKIFDQLDFSQKLLGHLLIESVQKNYTPQKVQRMINEEPSQEFYDKSFGIYDAVVKQGVESETQQDQYYFELVNLKREGIVDVPQSEILKALPLVGKSDLVESIEAQQEQAQQEAQRVAELEQMQKELINSQTEQNIALSQERRARVVADIGLAKERASEAEQNRASAALDRAKAMTEIQNLKQDQILKVMEFVNMLQMQEQAQQEKEETDVNLESDSIMKMTELKQNMKSGEANAEQKEI